MSFFCSLDFTCDFMLLVDFLPYLFYDTSDFVFNNKKKVSLADIDALTFFHC
jgi:hypothetical protein